MVDRYDLPFILGFFRGAFRIAFWGLTKAIPITASRLFGGNRSSTGLRSELVASLPDEDRAFLDQTRWFLSFVASFALLLGLGRSLSVTFFSTILLAFVPLAVGAVVAPRSRRITIGVFCAIYVMLYLFLKFGFDAGTRSPLSGVALLIGTLGAFGIAHLLDRRTSRSV